MYSPMQYGCSGTGERAGDIEWSLCVRRKGPISRLASIDSGTYIMIKECPTQHDLEQLVRDNLESVADLLPGQVAYIEVSGLRQQNAHSSRPGTKIVIHLSGDLDGSMTLWAKRVEDPSTAYKKMRASYELAATSNLHSPIPKPYFFDSGYGMIVMSNIEGKSLRKAVLQYCMGFGQFGVQNMEALFEQIGLWLFGYHSAVQTNSYLSLNDVIDEIQARLEFESTFSKSEKEQLSRILKKIGERQIGNKQTRLSWPHNDFTLRNMIVNTDDNFFVIDWDAMVHPGFSSEMTGWWDATLFFLNLQSLARFRPALDVSRIDALGSAFLSGYFGSADKEKGKVDPEDVNGVLFVFALRYWLGIGADRRISAIYKRNLGWRYSRLLRKGLLRGTANILTT